MAQRRKAKTATWAVLVLCLEALTLYLEHPATRSRIPPARTGREGGHALRACIVTTIFGRSSIWRVSPTILQYCATAFKGAIIALLLVRHIQANESAPLPLLLAGKIKQAQDGPAFTLILNQP